MKKVLLATTALVAFAGAASADVSLSGSARFGLQYNSEALPGSPSTTLEKRVTINIDASTETDSGLELGARVRIRSEEAATGTVMPGANVYLKSGGFMLNVGNICGALECMPGIYAGSMGLQGNSWYNLSINTVALAGHPTSGFWNWPAYSSTGLGPNGVEVTYSAGDFSGHLSYAAMNDLSVNPNVISAFLAYSFGDWTVALGAQEGDAPLGSGDKVVLTIGGNIGDFGVGLAVADNNGTKKATVNGSYTMGATTISAYVADEDTAGVDTSYGVTAAYDIGGATLVGGVSSVGFDTLGNSATVASAGIKFKF